MSLRSKLFDVREIPYGSRVVTSVVALYWVGWGFAESLIPVLLFRFGGSFAGAGILRSVYDIAFIIAMPLVGLYADKFRATSLLLLGLWMYVFIGSSYFLAGATGLVVFIVLARFVNGVSFSLVSVGREAFFRRHSPASKLGTVFGYFDTVANLAWIAAAVAGIWLVRILPVHYLLLLVAPAALGSILLLMRFRRDTKRNPVLEHRGTGQLRELFMEIRGFNPKLRFLAMFNFFAAFGSAVVTFFVPLEAFVDGASYTVVILAGIASAVPPAFGWLLGRLYDRVGYRVLGLAMVCFGLVVSTLAIFDSFAWKIALCLIVGFLVELLSIGWREVATMHTHPDHYGKMDGIFKSVADVGALLGPIVAGLAIDRVGGHAMFGLLGLLLTVFGVMFKIMFKLSRRQRAF